MEQNFKKKNRKELEPYIYIPPKKAKAILWANESPYNLPLILKIAAALKALGLNYNRYPESETSELRKAISEKLGISPDNILVGNGSDELIFIIIMALLRGASRVVVPHPTFSIYEYAAQALGHRVVKVDLEKDFSLNPVKIIERKPNMVFIAWPNNPTGVLYPKETLLKLTGRDFWLVIDEAYHEFSGETMIREAISHPRIIVLRTFSKAYSLANLRVGYLISRTETVELLRKYKLPFNVDGFSREVATLAMRMYPDGLPAVNKILKEKEKLFAGLLNLGLEVVPSKANFFMVKLGKRAKEIFEYLKEKGILVRLIDFPSKDNPRYIRITVGKSGENKLLLRELSHALQQFIS